MQAALKQISALGALVVFVLTVPAFAQDARLEDKVFASGLTRPSDLEFSPDGRLFFVEQAGKVKVFPSLNATTPIVVADLTADVQPIVDSGMHGLAVHPDFPAQPYLYISHAIGGGRDPAGRLLRMTIDPATNLEVPGARITLLEGWCRRTAEDSIHNINDVVFGPDGALYVSAGDWADIGDLTGSGVCPDPIGEGGVFRSQDRQTPGDPQDNNGAVIRIDPATGLPMPGNPFETAADSDLRYVIADGLRNPFRMAIRPGTEELWMGDVGESTFEEVDRIADINDDVVENFGWPCYEGVGEFAPGQAANPSVCGGVTQTPPVFQYDHGSPTFAGDACSPGQNGSSISAVGFYTGGNYPAEYVGALFLGDFSRNCVWAMLPDASGAPDPSNMVTVFENAAGPVDFAAGPNGDLFYSDVAGGTIRRIQAGSTQPPPPETDAVNVALGKPAQQSSAWDDLGPQNAVDGSLAGAEQQVSHTLQEAQAWWQVDLEQATEISEVVLWNRTDCCQERLADFHVLVSDDPFTSTDLQATINQPGVTDYFHAGTADRETRFEIQRSGRYVRVQLSGTNFLQLAEVEVYDTPTGAGQPPTVSIDSPTAGFQWVTGSPIAFSGSAVSAAGVPLPSSALQWAVLLNHCIGSISTCHQHQIEAIDGATGSVLGPDHGYPASVELRLTATDPDTGGSASASLTLQPQTVVLSFESSPSGLQLIAGESSNLATTPFTKEFIIGSTAAMIAPIDQTLGTDGYSFESWSDGGARVHSVPAPASATTYTATYTATSTGNHAPQAVNPGPQSGVEGGAAALQIVATDADDDPLVFSAGGLPPGLGIDPISGLISGAIAPGAAAGSPYSATVSASDGLEIADIAFSWTVTAAGNQQPTADAQALTTPYETPLAIALTGSDPDQDALSFAVATAPAHGALSGTAPALTYTPATGFFGADGFSFSVDDGRGGAAQATVAITVEAPATGGATNVAIGKPAEQSSAWDNLGPQNAVDGSLAGEEQQVSHTQNNAEAWWQADLQQVVAIQEIVLWNRTDCCQERLTDFHVLVSDAPFVSQGLQATIQQAGVADFHYPGSAGRETRIAIGRTGRFVRVQLSGSNFLQLAEVEVYATTGGNQPPTAQPQTLTTPYETPVTITLSGSDPDLDALTFAITTPPANGSLSGTAPNLTYTPATGFAGADAFGFSVDDGKGGVSTATVAINVGARPNQPPTAGSQTLTTPYETPLTITLSGSDPDLNALTYAVTTPPTHGSLSGTAPNLTYTPAAGFSGADGFGFSVDDGNGGLDAASVSITVGAPPAGGSSLTAEGVFAPAVTDQWQTVALSKTYVSPVVVCTPEYGPGEAPRVARVRAAGASSFELRAARFDGLTEPLSATPTYCLVVEEGVYGEAADGAKLEAVRMTSTVTDRKGSWVGEQRTYANAYSSPIVVGQVMTANDAAPSYFWARAGSSSSPPNATKLFVGKGVGEDPTTTRADETIGYIVLEAGTSSLAGLAVEAGRATGVQGYGNTPPYPVTLGAAATGATLSAAGMAGGDGAWPILYGPGALTASRLQAAVDEDQLHDTERGHTAEQAAYVAWTGSAPANQPPTADPQALTTPYGAPLALALTGSDPDSDPLTFAIATPPAKGQLSGTAPNLTYAPNAGATGADSFVFRVDDGRGGSAQATVSVTIGPPPNLPPTAGSQNLATAYETPLAITLTGSDPDLDALSFSIVTPPAHGTLSGTAPAVIYTPAAGFAGEDGFVFGVSDGRGGVDQATVGVTVAAQESGTVRAEVLTVGDIGSEQWTAAALTKAFVSPVVVCSPVYGPGDPGAVVRMRNVTAGGFEVRAARLDNGTGPIVGLTATCLAVEEGVYSAEQDGVTMEAVRYESTVTSSNASWAGEARSYEGAYQNPVVVGQVMTANDANWSVFWASGGLAVAPPNASALRVGKHLAEDPNRARAAETVGYIVLESGSGTLDGFSYEAAVGAAKVQGRDNAPPYSYALSLTGAFAAVVSSAGMAGPDGGWPVLADPAAIAGGSLELFVDEDQLRDAERLHAAERVAYVAFGAP
ncbi:MAG: tandem-95 repeat protein [Acidobacteria bacterium]|nr:tandem-95 repeat protein [Acidobacteriota bacterium]